MHELRQIFHTIQSVADRIKSGVEKVLSIASLTVTYWVGIGITALTAKIFGKHFLDQNIQKTVSKTMAKSWWHPHMSHSHTKMF